MGIRAAGVRDPLESIRWGGKRLTSLAVATEPGQDNSYFIKRVSQVYLELSPGP